jgi:predicted ATPase
LPIRLLARKLAGSTPVAVGTYRNAELDLTSGLADVLADLSREGIGEHLPLAPLSPADVSALIVDLHGAPVAPGLVDAVYSGTEGNPFFVTSVVRHLLSSGLTLSDATKLGERTSIPEGVRWVIRQRLSRLRSLSTFVRHGGRAIRESREPPPVVG